MPLSESQVVAVSKQPAIPKHDQSMWKGLVVGADEFAPPPKPRRSRAKWAIAGLLVAGAGGAGVYYFGFAGSSDAPPLAPVPASTPPPAPTPAPAVSHPAPPPPDAAPVADAPPPVDAAAPADAAPPPDAAKPAPAAVTKKKKKKTTKKLIVH